MFKIESGIPMPDRVRTGLGSEIIQTALRCKPSQSFLVPMARFRKLKHPLSSIPYKRARAFGMSLKARKESNGYRIWLKKKA